jgi:hypothetical protein
MLGDIDIVVSFILRESLRQKGRELKVFCNKYITNINLP